MQDVVLLHPYCVNKKIHYVSSKHASGIIKIFVTFNRSQTRYSTRFNFKRTSFSRFAYVVNIIFRVEVPLNPIMLFATGDVSEESDAATQAAVSLALKLRDNQCLKSDTHIYISRM